MENINLNKHYLIFKWAVSKDWKDKNGLYRSIQGKMNILKNEFDLSERDVVDDLFADYWERAYSAEIVHLFRFIPTSHSESNRPVVPN